jgi:mono/diheme cytochrome c family protein
MRGDMRRIVNMVNAAAIVAIAVGIGGFLHAARAQDAPAGDAVEGKRLYLADGCFLCHGRAGEGGAMNGPVPTLAKTQMPFDGFKGQLRQPANDMPAYTDKVMSDKQVADIYAFVQSLPGRRPPQDVPMLND